MTRRSSAWRWAPELKANLHVASHARLFRMHYEIGPCRCWRKKVTHTALALDASAVLRSGSADDLPVNV
jgi:hypothetical protein